MRDRLHRELHPLGTVRAISRELAQGLRVSADVRSAARFATDVLLYRALQLGDLPTMNRERTITLHGGTELTYRLNRGDIQGVREVWLDQAYRLPFDLPPTVVIDLGANIGLTSLFFAQNYGSDAVVAVEPDSSNARLARANLSRNGVSGEVVEAAVGARDGSARFQVARESNLGRLSGIGPEVPVVSMPSLLARTPDGFADLVKVDIEGAEEQVLSGDLGWLDRIGSMIVEFHPDRVDYSRLVGVVEQAGFRYVPANSVWPGSMDCFVRDGWSPGSQRV